MSPPAVRAHSKLQHPTLSRTGTVCASCNGPRLWRPVKRGAHRDELKQGNLQARAWNLYAAWLCFFASDWKRAEVRRSMRCQYTVNTQQRGS